MRATTTHTDTKCLTMHHAVREDPLLIGEPTEASSATTPESHSSTDHRREVDVTSIDNHELNALKIVDAAARVTTQHGPVIVILRQYAFHGLGRTIHSAEQFEHYKNMVDDRSMKAGGKQCICTKDGYVIPLDIINGLPYMKMEPHSDQEWNDLPHVILTAE